MNRLKKIILCPFHLKIQFAFCFLFGFLWVYSQTGYKSVTYKYSDGLSSDQVLSIDKMGGYLYLGTQQGLNKFDGYRFLKNKFSKDAVSSIFVKNKYLFYNLNGNGICSIADFQVSPQKITQVNYTDSNTNNDHFENIFVDDDHQIWCSDQNNIKALSKNNIKSWKIDNDGNLSELKLKFFSPNRNMVWAVTPFGVFVYDATKKTFAKHPNYFLAQHSFCDGKKINDSNILLTDLTGNIVLYSLITNEVSALNSPSKTALHFAKNEFGKTVNVQLLYNKNQVFVYDEKLKTIALIYQTQANINTVFYDNDTQRIWLGTNKGLVKLYQQESIESISIPFKEPLPITHISEDHVGNLWLANQSSEIVCLLPNKKSIKYNSPNPNVIFNGVFDVGKIIIVASDGLYQIKKQSISKIISLPFPILKVVKNDNKLYLMSKKNGIKVYDNITGKEINEGVQNSENYWKINLVNDIFSTHSGKIWLASWMPTSFGISYFDTIQHKFKEINDLKVFPNKRNFVTDYYNQIAETHNGNLLFSGYGGWNLVTPKGKIEHSFFTSKYHVANDNVVGIAEDILGNIWFGCAEGLYQYSFVTNKVIRISQADGLETNDITNGFCKLKENKIAISSDTGIQILNLDKLVKTKLINQLQLTSVKKDNLDVPISSNPFTFNYDFTSLEFVFSALTFSDNEKIVYRYRFSDEKEWNYLGITPKISFVKLPPGKYDIVIEAGDNLGNWQPQKLNVKLNINPPFYLNRWFLAGIVLLTLLLGYGITYYLVHQEKEKSKLKQKVKNVEMQTLRSQMNPHFLFNSLNAINSFIVCQKTKEASTYLTTFAKLMRNILDNSRQETISLEKEIATLEMYLQIERARLENKFSYETLIDNSLDIENIKIPPLILQPFVENAIWHGLVNANNHGVIFIEFKKMPNRFLQIIITDNGIGRAASALLKKEQQSHKSYGINITQERISLLNPSNKISFIDLVDENNKPKGTQVELKIEYYD